MADCGVKTCSGWSEEYENNCWHMDTKTYDHCFKPLISKTKSGAQVPCNGVLSDAEQAINALEKLAEHHEAINKLSSARSNREYIKVIKGQLICHKLVDEALGR